MTDKINHPKHYNLYKGIEIIDLVEQMNFNKGNAVKYVTRAGLKDPSTEIEDLKKAVFYLEREIQRLQDDNSRFYRADEMRSSEDLTLTEDYSEKTSYDKALLREFRTSSLFPVKIPGTYQESMTSMYPPRLERLRAGDYSFGCAGMHRGTGHADCPSTLHHHHDEFCTFPTTEELLALDIDPRTFRTKLRD